MDEIREWIESRPPRVREVAEKLCVPGRCLRSTENRGHYVLRSIEEPEDETEPVTVSLYHGADSFLPGFHVFGVPPETLVPCECGEWQWADEEQEAAAMAAAEEAATTHRGRSA